MKGDKLYSKAKKEAYSGNFKLAYFLLLKAAKLKNPKAFYALGNWYLHGRYVTRDYSKAIQYLSLAANEKNPNALYDLAVCYEQGTGLKKNLKRAFELYLKAALRGDKQSHYEVGRCYYYGIGISKNENLADLWLERAEELGITD